MWTNSFRDLYLFCRKFWHYDVFAQKYRVWFLSNNDYLTAGFSQIKPITYQ